ncbi:MAG: hypothetical protein E7577_00245 [Ruminococcaceae bacterium]|nr:hypothetical protein [Oscillospiraceae bacterium]
MTKKNTKAGTDSVRMRERLCHEFDIKPDIFLGETLIELRGRNSLTVRGGGGITAYGDKEIRFKLREGELSVKGERLACASFEKGAAVVDGNIFSVSFEEDA